MGACCEVAVDTDDFKKYCMENAGYHYQPILNRVQGKIRLDERQPYCVEGPWEKGQEQTGKGVIYSFQRFYYEGDIVKRTAQGTGRIIWPSRYIYHGEVANNMAEGQGQLKIEERNITVKGNWVNGLPKLNQPMGLITGTNEGSITFIFNQEEEKVKDEPIKEQDYFISKKVQVAIDFGTGITYEGHLVRKKNHYQIQGEGIMKFKDGSYYKGQFERGQMHGTGKFFWGDRGHWYEGYYKNNLRDGIGRYYYNQKEYDVGHWAGGRLKSNTAESVVKKEGDNAMVRSSYMPKVEELSPLKAEQVVIAEQPNEFKEEKEQKSEEREDANEPGQAGKEEQGGSGLARKQEKYEEGVMATPIRFGDYRQKNEAQTPINEVDQNNNNNI